MIIPPHNVANAERIVRICGGSALFYLLFFTGPQMLPVQTALASLSLYPVFTGLLGRCWLYGLCDVSTIEDDAVADEPEALNLRRAGPSPDPSSHSRTPRTSP